MAGVCTVLVKRLHDAHCRLPLLLMCAQAMQQRLDALEADDVPEEAAAGGSDDDEYVLAGDGDEDEEGTEHKACRMERLVGRCWQPAGVYRT